MLVSGNDIFKKLILLLFILFALDFLGMGWILFGGAVALVFFYVMTTGKKIEITSQFIWVILLAVSNFLIMYVHSGADMVTKIIKYFLSPIGGYLIGLFFASYENKNIEKLYLYAVIPYFLHGVLDIAIFDGFTGFERELADFWTGEMWKATLVCTYFAMTVPLCFVAFISKSKIKSVIFFVLTAFSIYATVITASRTVIYIGAIVIVMELFLYMSEGKFTMKKMKFLSVFLIFLLIAAYVVLFNLEKIESSSFFTRMTEMDMSEEPRIQLFKNILTNFWRYPFGNMPFFYSHNTWLDFLRESGWITFICFMAITIITVKHIIAIHKNKSLKQEQRISVIAMMVALLFDMFVEPVMDGAAILFCLFFYFIAVNSCYTKDNGSKLKCQN